MRELARALITEQLRPMIQAQMAKATGISFLVTRDRETGKFIPVTKRMLHRLDPKDVIEVWEKSPDTAAFKELADRAMDRPSQPVALTAKLDTSSLSDEELKTMLAEFLAKL